MLLAQQLRAVTGDGSFDFIEAQRGMFSLLGVSRAGGRAAAREASHLHDGGQPHESRRHHAAQRRITSPRRFAAQRALAVAGADLAGQSAWLSAVISAAESCITASVFDSFKPSRLAAGRPFKAASRPAMLVPCTTPSERRRRPRRSNPALGVGSSEVILLPTACAIDSAKSQFSRIALPMEGYHSLMMSFEHGLAGEQLRVIRWRESICKACRCRASFPVSIASSGLTGCRSSPERRRYAAT